MNTFPQQFMPQYQAGDRMEIGLGDDGEIVQRSAVVQVFQNLDAQIALQDQRWASRDLQYDQLIGRTTQYPFSTTRVESGNFYTGARPSLVEAPVSFWPSVTSRCNNARPSPEQFDQFDVFLLDLFVEVLTKVGPYPDIDTDHGAEDAIDRQAQRLTAAVHCCIRLDPTLGGVIMPIQRPPTITPSKLWPRKEDHGAGEYYYFQGKQLHYVVTRYSM